MVGFFSVSLFSLAIAREWHFKINIPSAIKLIELFKKLALLFDIRKQNVIKNESLEELDTKEGSCIKSFTDRCFAHCVSEQKWITNLCNHKF